jgi:hypothetical protein
LKLEISDERHNVATEPQRPQRKEKREEKREKRKEKHRVHGENPGGHRENQIEIVGREARQAAR